MGEKKIHSIFLGRKVRKYYVITQIWFKPQLEEKTETIERVWIKACDMTSKLRKGDEIYFEELGVYATIEKVTETDMGNMIYNVTYVTEIVDELEKTKQELQCEFSQLESDYNEREEEYKKKRQENDEKFKKYKLEYDERIQWKKDNPDRILGLIVYKLPEKSNNREIYERTVELTLTTPKEYNVIVTSLDVSYYPIKDVDTTINVVK